MYHCEWEVRREEGRTRVVVSGELDTYSAPRFNEALVSLVEAGHREVVLDVEKLTFVDSTGLTTILAGARACSRKGGRLVLQGPSRSVFRVLELTGVSNYLDVEAVMPPA